MMVLFSRRRILAQIVATALMVSGANAFAGSHMEVVPDGASQPSVVQVERLEKLATYLDTVNPKKFNMNHWGDTGNPDDPNYTGCAAGHATAIFRSDGFTLKCATSPNGPTHFIPTYEGSEEKAIERFFGINSTSSDHTYLFGTYSGREMTDPHAAANRIRVVTQKQRVRLAAEQPKPICTLASW